MFAVVLSEDEWRTMVENMKNAHNACGKKVWNACTDTLIHSEMRTAISIEEDNDDITTLKST